MNSNQFKSFRQLEKDKVSVKKTHSESCRTQNHHHHSLYSNFIFSIVLEYLIVSLPQSGSLEVTVELVFSLSMIWKPNHITYKREKNIIEGMVYIVQCTILFRGIGTFFFNLLHFICEQVRPRKTYYLLFRPRPTNNAAIIMFATGYTQKHIQCGLLFYVNGRLVMQIYSYASACL